MNSFAELVEGHLAARNMRRADLARSTDYSPSYITNMMNGLRVPPPDAVERIAGSLGLSEDDTTALHSAAAQQRGYRTEKTGK